MYEKELVKQAKAGDFKAFSTLIKANKQKIYALALKMTANKDDAEDIVQETLLKAIDNIDKFREESTFGTWLYSIALNQSRAHLSKIKQSELKAVEAYLPSGGDTDALHDSVSSKLFDWDDPHRQLENRELRDIINEAIQTLPLKYREAFILRYIDELSIKEIAQLTNNTISTIKPRVLRAKLAIREYLANTFKERYGQKMS